MKLKFLLLLVGVVVAVRTLLPAFHLGIPITHDGQGHVARMANYAVALRQGQLPPRFAPTFNDGYGYPVFNFHYPLLSMVGAPFVLLGLNPEVVTTAVIIVSWLLLWWGVYLYSKHLTGQALSAGVALIVFITSPYLYTLIYIRGSYGELFALTATIWLLYVIEVTREIQKSDKRTYVFSIVRILIGSLLLLAHNIYAAILFPLLCIYALWRKKSLPLIDVIKELFLSFSLTAFFWIPALLEKKYVVFDEKFTNFYVDHFLQLRQLFELRVHAGVSTTGGEDTLTYGIGISALATVIVTLWYFIKQQSSHKKINVCILGLFVTTLIAIFCMLPISLPLWKVSFILPYLQFPWRILGPVSLMLSLLAGYLFSAIGKIEKYILIIFSILSAIAMFFWYYPSYTHETRDYYLNYRQNTTFRDELRVKTFTLAPGKLSSQQPLIIGDGTVTIDKWRGTYRTYTVQAKSDVIVVEPTMYFIGWKVYANDKEVPLNQITQQEGQVAYSLPAGEWKIKSSMTQLTPARVVGNTLSLVTLIILSVQLAIVVSSYKKRTKNVE